MSPTFLCRLNTPKNGTNSNAAAAAAAAAAAVAAAAVACPTFQAFVRLRVGPAKKNLFSFHLS